MNAASDVIASLRAKGELWEHAPGLTGLRGATLGLYRQIEAEVAALAAGHTGDEWRVPPAVSFATLARADYFASFPQWLSAVAHMDTNDESLARVANAPDKAGAAVDAMRPTPTALQPAVCYHVYSALAGRILDEPTCCTVQGTCWRNERDRFVPLERSWAFTMREVVCAGAAEDVEAFRQRGLEEAVTFAQRLGLLAQTVTASDPFFAPSARGRALLQRIKSLKHELLLPLGDGRSVAAASFNNHERFFGDAFDIRLRDGTSAVTGCIAFGIERWLLAVLVEHGTDPRNWPLQPAPTMEASW